jgi:predicted hotdog family 3-hydroxylacyl-ACP dehydratase
MSAEYGPVADYLPHRPPMLLIDHIDDVNQHDATCRTTIKPDCVFAQDGLVHPSAMIEFVAQVCAIAAGVTASRTGGPPRLGFIIGCREITFDVDSFAVGDELTIVITKVLGEEQLAVFNGTVSRGGALCVKIQLSVVDAELAGTQFSTSAGSAEG